MDSIYNYEFVKEKIESELKELDKSTDKKVKAVGKYVADKLIQFAKNETFGRAIQESESKLIDCCIHVVKGVTNHISDIEVYRKAAQFYFPKSDVEFSMNIVVSDEKRKKKSQKINISLDDLF